MQKACAVLIVGAGPTGLVLALSLAKQGISLRIIDSSIKPGETSRAMALHARTLELYRQLGIADKIIQQGIKTNQIHIRKGTKEVASLALGDIGLGLSPFPFVLTYPQDQHEQFLIKELAEYGVYVERQHRLVDFVENELGIIARVETPSEIETINVSWICGCDGAHSQVRKTMGLTFPGGTFPQLFYVADVQLQSDYRTEIMASIATNSLSLRFPIRSQQMQRLIGLVPPEQSDSANIKFNDIQCSVEKLLDIKVTKVNWFATYHVHNRVAEKFHKGRAYLLGDAAHIHSPAGGQGMNTGIGDAVNLAWKLTEVISLRASPKLLTTYEPERIAFARKLVATTDKALRVVVGSGFGSRILRGVLLPYILPHLTKFTKVREQIFKTISQIQINYRHSQLSVGGSAALVAGDRLPWIATQNDDNYTTLQSISWKVHVYGDASPALQQQCSALEITLNIFDWNQAADTANILKNTLYLIRPDGYVAFINESQDVSALLSYIEEWKLIFKDS